MGTFINKMRKALSALLAVCFLAAALPVGALAIEVDYETVAICGGFIRVNRYTGVLQSSTQNLTGDLVIPEEVHDVKITSIADSAFYGCEALNSVTVPSSVQSIGDQAFMSCLALKSVTISEGVRSLGKDVFRYCYSLTDVSLPSTLTAVQDYSFNRCIALTSISIPSGVRSLGNYAFAECGKLVSVSLPDTLVSMGDYCFSDCSALTSVNLPAGLSEIPTALFSGCSSLQKLVLPDGVQSISGLAFRSCRSLSSLSLPNSVTSIRASAFDDCGNVTFHVNAGSYAQAFAAANKIPFELGLLDPDPKPDDGPGNYPATPFTDDKNHWARKYVEWAYAMGYFAGTGPTTFSPNAPVNRGMMVSLLYRMEGSPAAGTSSFSDVSSKSYYAGAVAWAESVKVVSGITADRFAPAQNISREQLAAMLFRYAQYKGMDTSKRGDLSQFKDTARISSYAGTAMAWAVGSGIISGKGNATLDPRGNATRAEAAVMLQKFSTL